MLKKLFFDNDLQELIKHSKNYIGAHFISIVFSFIALIFFTRFLTPSEFGIMSVFESFTALFSILLGLGIRGAIVRYYHENKEDFHHFFSSNISLFFFIGIFLISLLSFICFK